MKISLTNILSLLLIAGLITTQGSFAAMVSLTSNAVKKDNQSTFGGYIGNPNSTLTGEVRFTLSGKDAQHFGVGQNNGQWFLRATHNFAQDEEYEITITADNGSEKATESFTIQVGSGNRLKKDARGERIYLPIVDGVVPVIGQAACGTFRIGDWELHHNVFGMSGHPSDKFEQFIFKDKSGEFGWACQHYADLRLLGKNSAKAIHELGVALGLTRALTQFEQRVGVVLRNRRLAH